MCAADGAPNTTLEDRERSPPRPRRRRAAGASPARYADGRGRGGRRDAAAACGHGRGGRHGTGAAAVRPAGQHPAVGRGRAGWCARAQGPPPGSGRPRPPRRRNRAASRPRRPERQERHGQDKKKKKQVDEGDGCVHPTNHSVPRRHSATPGSTPASAPPAARTAWTHLSIAPPRRPRLPCHPRPPSTADDHQRPPGEQPRARTGSPI